MTDKESSEKNLESNSQGSNTKKSQTIDAPVYEMNWPLAYPPLAATGQYRKQDEDFQVTELSNRQLKEDGPHWYLFIEKRGTNTHWLARQLANHANVNLKDIGYAGLKDRHAITRQWFSVPINKTVPDLDAIWGDEFTLLRSGFYGAKLKRGALGGNRFRLTLRDVSGSIDAINQRLELIRQRGVPNYFGPQRFGNQGENLQQAHKLFVSGKRPRNRQKASIYISSARSYLFNEIVKWRVENELWDRPMSGEVYGFAGGLRGFRQEHSSEERERWRQCEIHPTAAMWGRGQSLSEEDLSNLETSVAQRFPVFSEGIEKQGIKQERRASRLMVPDLSWQWLESDQLVLQFSLPSGYYATSILRELGQMVEATRDFDRSTKTDEAE